MNTQTLNRRLRRFLPLILCLCLALGGLPAYAAQEQSVGGYIEEELKLPEGYVSLSNPATMPDGNPAMAGKRADTGAWDLLVWQDLQADPAVMPLQVPEGDISGLYIAPDGQVMATISQMSGDMAGPDGQGHEIQGGAENKAPVAEGEAPQEAGTEKPLRDIMLFDEMKTRVVWFDASGAVTAQFEIKNFVMNQVALSGRRTAVVGANTGVDVYDETGALLLNIPQNDVFNLAVMGEDLCLVLENKLSIVDISNGKELRAISAKYNWNNKLTAAADGTLYMAGDSGIHKLPPQGDAFVKLGDVTGFWIGDPQGGLSGVCALVDGSLLAYLGNGGFSTGSGGMALSFGQSGGDIAQTKLVLYRYSATLDLSQRTPFVISALRDNAKLRKAVSDFQRAHPELAVKLQTQLAEDDYSTPEEDAIRTLNTDLLAGKGGDVLILDGLPLAQYIAKGVLRPIDDALADIGFFPGILAGSRHTDGKIYAMPGAFSVPTLWGDQEKLAGANALTALAAMPLDPHQNALRARTPQDWLRTFYPSSEGLFRNEQGTLRFDNPDFVAFLDALYRLYAAQLDRVEESQDPALRGNAIDLGALSAMQSGALALYDARIAGTMQVGFCYTAAGANEKTGVSLLPSLHGEGTVYTPSMLAGISARTTQEALAVEFLRSLYAPEVQEMEQMDGMPTVAASLQKLIDTIKEANKPGSDTQMAVIISDGTSAFEIGQPDNKTWDALYALLSQVNTPAVMDETLLRFMVEETAGFFEGQGDAQTAARALDQRAAAYLGE